MVCTPLHLKTHFVHTIPWNNVSLLFKCSLKLLIMSVRRSDKQTLAVFVHTISTVKLFAGPSSHRLWTYTVTLWILYFLKERKKNKKQKHNKIIQNNEKVMVIITLKKNNEKVTVTMTDLDLICHGDHTHHTCDDINYTWNDHPCHKRQGRPLCSQHVGYLRMVEMLQDKINATEALKIRGILNKLYSLENRTAYIFYMYLFIQHLLLPGQSTL